MGYLFLFIALFGGILKAYCGKVLSLKINNENDSLIFNFFRMILCVFIGFFISLFTYGDFSVFKIGQSTLILSLFSGLFSSLFVILWMISVKNGAYAMVDVFVMSGTFIPMVGSLIFFKENVKIHQWIGFLIVIFGVFVIISYNNSVKTKITKNKIFLLICVAISSGMADFTQKLFAVASKNVPNAVFNFYTYVFSAVFIFIMVKKVETNQIKSKLKISFGYIFLMAAGLFVNSFFKVESAKILDAVKLYPLNQGLALVLGMLMAHIFFDEKINSKCIFGIFLGLVGMCMINML